MEENQSADGRHAGTRSAIIDAAMEIMREDGYAAVTSRRLAEHAGFKSKLVHYYFKTMDDLFLAVFTTNEEKIFEHQTRALTSDHPIRTLWEVHANTSTAKLGVEITAVANHRKSLRQEIARDSERSRKLHSVIFERSLREAGVDISSPPPIVLALLMTAISRLLAEDSVLGISAGHSETAAFIEKFLRSLEAKSPARDTNRSNDDASREPRRTRAGKAKPRRSTGAA